MRGRYRYRQLHGGAIIGWRETHQKPAVTSTGTIHVERPEWPIEPNPYPSKKTLTQKRKQSQTLVAHTAGSDSDILEWNRAITAHMRRGRCKDAVSVFNAMPRRSCVSYNAMISGYVKNGRFDLAREVFDGMPSRDLFSWNVMLGGYVRKGDLGGARALFERMPERDVVSWNSMLSGYAQNGMVDKAREVFYRIPERNGVSWNALLSAYVQNGRMQDAKCLFELKGDWELVSWNCLMGGLVRKKRLVEAWRVFGMMPVRDEVSWNIMITGFAQNGEVNEARRLFDECPNRDVFTWTAMVSGYVQNGMLDEARQVFDNMPEKNPISWNAMIAGYVQHKRMDMARKLFDAMPCQDVSSWNTMITGYSQNGDIAYARDLFDRMPRRDSISWSAIIAGYTQCGYSEEALRVFVQLTSDGESLIRSSFTCAFAACANIAALELGRQIHDRLIKAGYGTGCFVGNALLSMYFRCGAIDEACDVFEQTAAKDIVSWNTVIHGYARHGFGNESLAVFESMKTAGIKPDDATMVGVLSACAHAGLVDKGTQYFSSMDRDYGITPKILHYTCMVDLLGRAGQLEEAHNLMRKMPFTPDAATWGALLGASRMHGNTYLGEKAAKIIFEMEPNNPGMYVLLSNLYASSKRWQDAGKMRAKMRDKGVKKFPGHSWIERQNQVHLFTVGDTRHPERDKIYAFLDEMDLRMRQEGYVSSTKLVLHDVEEEEKEHLLKYHSEKLAVAYGVISIPPGRPIRVIKNLRVCEDCHSAIKFISRITGRVIILRDNNRFHHFKEGSCSCGDYW